MRAINNYVKSRKQDVSYHIVNSVTTFFPKNNNTHMF